MILRADAFHLPFLDETFDLVVADPPYDIGKNKAGRGKRGVSVRPYVGFRGREWITEALRVLKPTGRLYVFCAVSELAAWFSVPGPVPPPSTVLSWHAPNAFSISHKFKKAGNDGRMHTWRPVIEWKRPDAFPLQRVDGLSVGSSIVKSLITSQMHESLPWPNQIPLAVMRWLIAPVRGSSMLDLFAGTGTARAAAEHLGWQAVSVELSPEAITINRGRPDLFPMPARAGTP